MVRKENAYYIQIVILAVLLILTIVSSVTLAYFTGSDEIRRNIKLGQAISLSIVNEQNEEANDEEHAFISGENLLPGSLTTISASVLFGKSTTPSLLRAKIDVAQIISNAPSDRIPEITQIFNDALNSSLALNVKQDWVLYNGWWYYIGENEVSTDVTETVVSRIDSSGDDLTSRVIEFVSGEFKVPEKIGNIFANSEIRFKLNFQAVQGNLPSYDENEKLPENEENGRFRINKIKNIIDVFNESF